MKVSTRQIVSAGLLSALTVTLGATGWGFFPIPTPAGAATIMHIPVIIAGIMEGPLVGAFAGLLFSLFTLQYAPPWVVIPARLLIGPAAYFTFKWLRWSLDRLRVKLRWGSPVVAAALAGLVGSAVNTSTLILAVKFGLFTAEAAWLIVLQSAIAEAILAAVVIGILIMPLLSANRSGRSKERAHPVL